MSAVAPVTITGGQVVTIAEGGDLTSAVMKEYTHIMGTGQQ